MCPGSEFARRPETENRNGLNYSLPSFSFLLEVLGSPRSIGSLWGEAWQIVFRNVMGEVRNRDQIFRAFRSYGAIGIYADCQAVPTHVFCIGYRPAAHVASKIQVDDESFSGHFGRQLSCVIREKAESIEISRR